MVPGFTMFENLNVVQILRVGLAGLCFLLSLLAFWLIQREQQRTGSPRRGILRAIYSFMALNLLAALLVSASAYFVPTQKMSMGGELTSPDYLVDYTDYLVDLTKWTPTTLGPVDITRSDYIRKVSETREDFVIHYFTTGTQIKCEPLTHGTQPNFTGPWQDPGDKRQHYDYRLPIGYQPLNTSELISSRFTFADGFHDPQHEWWQANVAYPAKTLSVVLRFPPNKPARRLDVYKIAGINGKEPINDNRPVSPDGGNTYMWVGVHIDSKTRIQFDWDW
jgi:hypothetical protein